MIFENTDFRQEVLDLHSPYDVKLVQSFLKKYNFDFLSEDVDYTMILYNLNGNLIGTGSHKGKILKYVVVEEQYRESSAFAQIVTHLTDILLQHEKYVFVFTLPANIVIFEGIGFKHIASAPPLFSVLEFGYKSITDYVDYLLRIQRDTHTDNIAAMVVNCNPFTNGHLFLIEKAASESELLYLFVVEEEHSAFPFDIRWKLIENGIAHLKNVVMVKGGEYIVSGSIFPSYFLKNEEISLVSQKQAELDVNIFANYVVPTLQIKKRYIGTENLCKTTAAYNKAMHEILPKHNVEVIEIKRKAIGMCGDVPNFISASKVRQAIRENNIMSVIEFLPESTANFLLSNDSWEIRQKIKKSDSRH